MQNYFNDKGVFIMRLIKESNELLLPIVETDYGYISISNNVLTDFVRHLIEEIPGMQQIEIKNFISKTTQSGEVEIQKADSEDSIDLNVSVCVLGTVKVTEAAEELQKRLRYEIPQILGIKIDKVILHVKKIVFE